VTARSAFFDQQLRLLEPFEFLVAVVATQPFAAIEVAADAHGQLHASLGPRPPEVPLSDAAHDAARRLGFVESDGLFTHDAVIDAPIDGSFVDSVLSDVFGADGTARVDLHHGSRRAEYEAGVKIAALRERIGPLLKELTGEAPVQDEDGDFVIDWHSTQVFVAPRAIPGGPVVIRIFAITNVDVTVTPDLAMFIARINFGLVLGRFALDLEHAAVWFIETLVGDLVSDEEIRYAIGVVAETADDWDDRIAQMFGGFTWATAPEHEEPRAAAPLKPGEGGYL
jgi:hypothetical protein